MKSAKKVKYTKQAIERGDTRAGKKLRIQESNFTVFWTS